MPIACDVRGPATTIDIPPHDSNLLDATRLFTKRAYLDLKPPGARQGSVPARCWRQRSRTIPARDARRGVGDTGGRGVRVQSAATAVGRADRRPLLPGGSIAVRPADAA